MIREGRCCDVLVIGSGIAGIMAAVSAAKQGKRVILASEAPTFSGSSFYPGTWGLGVVTPEDGADEIDMVHSILKVGCGMADEELVRSFVKGMRPTLQLLEREGLKLKSAEGQEEREFIPCFDRKRRNWHGLEKEHVKAFFKAQFQKYQIECMPDTMAVRLCHGRENAGENMLTEALVTGAIVVEKRKRLIRIEAKATVLATGGYGGLFEKTLTTGDVSGMGHFLALEAGGELLNMEFLQMMPGFIVPGEDLPTIFNEKTFRFAELKTEPLPRELLEERSTYGPFTSRLKSRAVDFAIVRKEQAALCYEKRLHQHMPELIRIYFDWLGREKGLGIDDEIQISMYAHAANGGIHINECASTGVPGLFACGEVTGGMHGADRIGGLSTMNGFVFGRRAGEAAAEFAEKAVRLQIFSEEAEDKGESDIFWEMENRADVQQKLREMMSETAMIRRNAPQLERGIAWIDKMLKTVKKKPSEDAGAIAESQKVWAQLHVASAVLLMQLARRESKGSHYRKEFPQEEAEFRYQQFLCYLEDQTVKIKSQKVRV